ncbi:MAG: radical SAM protein, partial [Proteobacteria bacterium]|nr:radical SAM protein [Pseudomonadota bacterium]
AAAKKKQNRITEYRSMLLSWKKAGVITYAGYILGFPNDTPESIRSDIEIIQRELPLDILEFFCLTPLPGSEDHKKLWLKGVAMDADLNKYDLEHVVTDHPVMTRQEWQAIYQEAWRSYYTPAHMKTILRRGAASGMGLKRLMAVMFLFSSYSEVEKLHPLQGGLFRLKYRRDRRPTMPREPAWLFYPRYGWEILSKHMRMAWRWMRIDAMRREVLRDPGHRAYMDQALTPVTEDDTETLDLLTQTDGARAAVERARKMSASAGRVTAGV